MPAQFALPSDLACVTKTISEFNGCPEIARKMFVDGLASALGQEDVSERHEYQQRFLSATQNVLRDAQRGAVETKKACFDAVQKVEAELEAQRASSSEAVKVEQDRRTEAEAKTALLQEAKQQVTRTEREHKKVEEAKDRLCKEREQVKQEKSQHDAIADGSFRMLLDGGWEDEEMKSAVVEAVQTHLTTCKADEVLIAAASAAVGTKPANRHPFDNLTVNCIAEVFKAQEAKITQRLAAGETEEEQICAHALGMWAVADVARDAHAAAETHSQAATDSLEASSVIAHSEAEKVIKQEAICATCVLKHREACELEQEVEGAMAALERLIANQYRAQTAADKLLEESTAMVVDSATEVLASSKQPEVSMEIDSNEMSNADAPHLKMEDCAEVPDASSAVAGGA